MNDSLTPKIKCPFFVNMTKLSISCEGIESDKLVQWFLTDDQKIEVIENYCNYYPNGCHLAHILEAKYDNSTM